MFGEGASHVRHARRPMETRATIYMHEALKGVQDTISMVPTNTGPYIQMGVYTRRVAGCMRVARRVAPEACL